MRVLLFGKDGQLGMELQHALAPLGELVAVGRREPGGDFLDATAVARAVARVRPDVVVNAAAYTDVDRAEQEPQIAEQVNARAPGALAHAANAAGAWLVHYSTDYVFDGQGTSPWRETDRPNPLNIYGRSKLLGDEQVSAGCERHLILRSSWLHGPHGQNFVRKILRAAQERASLTVVADQVGAPTQARWLASVTAAAIAQAVRDSRKRGLYHVAASGATSRHACAQRIVARALAAGAALRLAPQQVVPVPGSADPCVARRPANSRLDTSLFEHTFGLAPPSWESGIDETVLQLLAQAA